LARIENQALVGGWEKWLTVMETQAAAGAVMQRCLVRIENGVTTGAFDKWVEVVQWDTQAATDAQQASAMRELDEVKGRLEREKREKAGRKVQYCLNKIVSAKYVQAWDRWLEVKRAMERAGRIMHRTMCRITNGLQVGGWERWTAVLEGEKRAAEIMQACLGRIDNTVVGSAMSKWTQVIRTTKEQLRRSQDKKLFSEGQADIMLRVKARLFFSFLLSYHFRMMAGSFIAWQRYRHLTDSLTLAKGSGVAAAAAAVAARAVRAARAAALVAESVAVDDEVANLLSNLKGGNKSMSELARHGANKTLYRMLCRKASDTIDAKHPSEEVTRVGGVYMRKNSTNFVRRKSSVAMASTDRMLGLVIDTEESEGGRSDNTNSKSSSKSADKSASKSKPTARKFILEYFRMQHGNELTMSQEGKVGKVDTVTKKKVNEFLLALIVAEVLFYALQYVTEFYCCCARTSLPVFVTNFSLHVCIPHSIPTASIYTGGSGAKEIRALPSFECLPAVARSQSHACLQKHSSLWWMWLERQRFACRR
jgi:hypothetical protein